VIRFIWIGALLAVLCIVLYVPSAVPPEQLAQVLRAEHEINTRLWGSRASDRILERMLDFQAAAPAVAAAPPATVSVGGAGVDAAMAAQVAQMSMRLFGSPYLRSVDALFALAAYRMSTLLHALPLLLVFMAICAVDGLAVRRVRARELAAHSAELYTVSVTLGITLLALVAVTTFVPVALGPLVALGALLVTLFALSRAIANYHFIG
jgi:hypothetical protein